MRALLLPLLFACLLLATALPASDAAGLPVTVSISAPHGVGVGASIVVMGRADTIQSQPMIRASVTILQDEKPVANVTADNTGFYRATIKVPGVPSDISLRAHARSPGGLIAGESRNITVLVRERSTPPQNAVGANDGATRSVHLSWAPPADTRGADLLSYRITRDTGATTRIVGTADVHTLTLEDHDVFWGVAYRYHVYAITFAGASDSSNVAEVTLPPQPSAQP